MKKNFLEYAIQQCSVQPSVYNTLITPRYPNIQESKLWNIVPLPSRGWCQGRPTPFHHTIDRRVVSCESTVTVSMRRDYGTVSRVRGVVVVARRQMGGKRTECMGAIVAVGPRDPSSTLCRTRHRVTSDGLTQFFSALTGGPDEVRLSKKS